MTQQISIVQNFICTKEQRLNAVCKNVDRLTSAFPDTEFFVNYNTDINFATIKDWYLTIPHMNLFNNLQRDWALITLAMVNQVTTPYTMYICEDMMVNCQPDEMQACLTEFTGNDLDFCFLGKIGNYTKQEYVNGYTPYNDIPSPGYKPMEYGYFYEGRHAPHKRISIDAIFRTNWFKDRLQEFLVEGEGCTHDIPFRKRHLPNFYEGYYDFANGMRRFPDMKCYIPAIPIFEEYNDVKDKD